MKKFKGILKCISEKWERFLFSISGIIFLYVGFDMVFKDRVVESSVVFGLGFFSFIYANVSRFKRFKGLGFEAELWEDKQKEAADLIERLREVVAIYTREIILGKVTAGRWSDGVEWTERWKLYDDLVRQHNVLGQKIDFSDVKKIMDDYFLFDMSMPEINRIRMTINKYKEIVNGLVHKEFGNPVRDAEGFSKRMGQLAKIEDDIKNPLAISGKDNLAKRILDIWHGAKKILKGDFGIDAEIEQEVVDKLEIISDLYQSRPVNVTAELIKWANHEA